MMDLPPDMQERIVCSIHAVIKYEVPANILLAVAEKEGGKPGQWVKNSNDTYDVGPMQFNTAYLSDLAKYGDRRTRGEARVLFVCFGRLAYSHAHPQRPRRYMDEGIQLPLVHPPSQSGLSRGSDAKSSQVGKMARCPIHHSGRDFSIEHAVSVDVDDRLRRTFGALRLAPG